MATYLVNTADAIESLVDTGMPQDQAKAVVQIFAETQEELVTKSDLSLVEERLSSKIQVLDTKLQTIDVKIDSMKSKVITWVLGGMIGAAGLIKLIDVISSFLFG